MMRILIFLLFYLSRGVSVVMDRDVGHPTDLPTYCQYCECIFTNDSLFTDCTHKGLSRTPRKLLNTTTELIMKDNYITAVKKVYFTGYKYMKVLDLSHNRISEIELEAFSDLVSLEKLSLHSQTSKMFIPQTVFKNGVFKGLIHLRHLSLHNNVDIRDVWVSEIPTDALTELPQLEELTIDGVEHVVFDEKFLALKKLSTVFMSGKSGTCDIQSLSGRSFVGIPNIKNLTLEKCRINIIGKGTFWNTPNLEYLDISWNWNLEFAQVGKISEELQYSKLEILKIDAIHNPDHAGTEILRDDMRHIRNLNVKEVHMNDNGIEYIDFGVFQMFPKTMKRLYMRRNKLQFGSSMISEAVFNNDNLEVFDAADQVTVSRVDRIPVSKLKKILIDGFPQNRRVIRDISINQENSKQRIDTRVIENTEDKQLAIRNKRNMPDVILQLKVLICSGSHSDLRLKSYLNFNNTINEIEVLDLSRNFMNIISRGSFYGLSKVKHLNLSDNYIEYFTKDIFHGLETVQVLDLSNNLFHNVLGTDTDGEIFAPLGHLTHLNLSSNRIYALKRNVFRNMRKLIDIDISENYLDSLDIDFKTLKNLAYLKLSNNRLQTIPEDVRKSLSTFAKYHTVQIDLRYNKFACNCVNIPFLEWLIQPGIHFIDRHTYYCVLKNESIRVFNESVKDFIDTLKYECKSYTDIIIACSTGGSFLFAVILCVTVYLNRWKLRYLYYMAKVKLDHHGNDKLEREEFMYDIFLSYGDGDRQFVVTDIIEMLENELQLRLNIRDRDFEIGELIAVNISKAIKVSKKTFLLVSRHFLANKWCNFEMNMARMEAIYKKRDVMVILFLEAIPPHALPIELVDLLRECPNMEFPKDKKSRFAFWQKCKEHVYS